MNIKATAAAVILMTFYGAISAGLIAAYIALPEVYVMIGIMLGSILAILTLWIIVVGILWALEWAHTCLWRSMK
jgi:hypothetical protein